MEDIIILLKFAKFWSDFGAGDDFLDPSRVESIDKKSIFDLDSSTFRKSLTRAFQITTHRLPTTTAREDMEEKVNWDGLE